jgi:hypothetical protein
VTVGSGATDCSIAGGVEDDVCRVWGRAEDAAGNATLTLREFAIDLGPGAVPIPALPPSLLGVLGAVLGLAPAARSRLRRPRARHAPRRTRP